MIIDYVSMAMNAANASATTAPRSGALGRRVLREEIRDRLIDQILRGALKPGTRIVETRVARELGVSQSPVREALRDLELLGFVVSAAFRGTRVRAVSNEELVDLYPIRASLEGVAARAAATRIDEETLANLEELIAVMLSAASREDVAALVEADTAFHQMIVDAAGNRMLKQFWEAMRLTTTTFISVSVAHISLVELAQRHSPVLAALRGHDPEIAEVVMKRHIEGLGEWVYKTREPGEPAKPQRVDQTSTAAGAPQG